MTLNHPYTEFERSRLWLVMEKAVSELEENNDIRLTTAPEYVIGYFCKQLSEADLINELGLELITE